MKKRLRHRYGQQDLLAKRKHPYMCLMWALELTTGAKVMDRNHDGKLVFEEAQNQ